MRRRGGGKEKSLDGWKRGSVHTCTRVHAEICVRPPDLRAARFNGPKLTGIAVVIVADSRQFMSIAKIAALQVAGALSDVFARWMCCQS